MKPDNDLNSDQIQQMESEIMTAVSKSAIKDNRKKILKTVVVTSCAVLALSSISYIALNQSGLPINNSAGADHNLQLDGRDSTRLDFSAEKTQLSPGINKTANNLNANVGLNIAESQPIPEPTIDKIAREIIRQAQLSLVVDDVPAKISEITEITTSVQGYIDQLEQFQQRNGDNSESQYLNATLRVPADALDKTIEELKKIGKTSYSSVSNQDVTLETQDLDAKIDALKISITRLQNLMKNADNLENLLSAEEQLTYRQSELDSLNSQRSYYSNQVSYSTINLQLSPSSSPASIDTGGFLGGLVNGWNSLVAAAGGLLVGAGFVLPWILLLAVIGGGVWLVLKKRKAKTDS